MGWPFPYWCGFRYFMASWREHHRWEPPRFRRDGTVVRRCPLRGW